MSNTHDHDVKASHSRNGDEYVTIVSHPLEFGNYKFFLDGPDGKTPGEVNIGRLVHLNRASFVRVEISQKNAIPEIKYTVAYKLDNAVKWKGMVSSASGLIFEMTITTHFRYLTLKIIAKKESKQFVKSSLSDFDIYNNKDFSDVVVKCGNTKFECHQLFLTTRSPVFKAMLTSDKKEKNRTNEIQVVDVKPEVMAELIEFIYTGKSSNLDKYAMDLLIAADKFQMDSLKELCEKKLLTTLGIKNCFSLLIMGDKYSPNIKKYALKFAIENRKSIKFEDCLAEHPSLMTEILKEVFAKGDECDETCTCPCAEMEGCGC